MALAISKTSKYSVWSLSRDISTIDISSNESNVTHNSSPLQFSNLSEMDEMENSMNKSKKSVNNVPDNEEDCDLNSALTMLGGSFAM